ncbi:MAG: metallophosphoesterase [archaeon]
MIGIISDTHDNIGNIKKAISVFKARNVDFAFHCGDIVAPFTVTFFKDVKMKFIQGNCDGDIPMIRKNIELIGGEFLGTIAEFNHGGKKFAAYHGNLTDVLDKLISSKKYDYVLTGHTHKRRDELIGKTRVINPGAHYYGAENTIALLDVEKNKLELIQL